MPMLDLKVSEYEKEFDEEMNKALFINTKKSKFKSKEKTRMLSVDEIAVEAAEN